jgi:hypothetical protein
LFLVDQEKPGWPGSYWSVSLSRLEIGMLDVSDEDDRRLVSVDDLPKSGSCAADGKGCFVENLRWLSGHDFEHDNSCE